MWASEPLTLAALVAVLGAGCASKSNVLEGASGSASNPWTSCGVPDLAPFMQESKLGDACTFGGGCGLAVGSHCVVENRSCQHGVLFGLTTEALDCPAPTAGDSGAAPAYADCAAALGSAKTGDTCAWQGVCAKPSPDECCIELAACGDVSISSVGPGRVLRGHVCAPGCANLTPVAGLPAATGCPTGDLTDPGLGRPCAGNFVCVNGTEDLGGIGAAQSTSDLTWCDHGVVVGGTTFLWLP